MMGLSSLSEQVRSLNLDLGIQGRTGSTFHSAANLFVFWALSWAPEGTAKQSL